MNEKQIILEVLSKEELKKLIADSVNEAMDLKRSVVDPVDQLLTREEACKFLKINSSTLWNWTKKGKITSYGIASRKYYKKNELLDTLIKSKF
ncbi:helix-turn-helix domain-containing protein [Lutibacter holmesii]|uniref:Helix-turn-helix domain-containing protein n=1 Tax=Lutibacter holmesii TaxID=1137985 RepID=A0ABW3WJQ0_9FLAO